MAKANAKLLSQDSWKKFCQTNVGLMQGTVWVHFPIRVISLTYFPIPFTYWQIISGVPERVGQQVKMPQVPSWGRWQNHSQSSPTWHPRVAPSPGCAPFTLRVAGKGLFPLHWGLLFFPACPLLRLIKRGGWWEKGPTMATIAAIVEFSLTCLPSLCF